MSIPRSIQQQPKSTSVNREVKVIYTLKFSGISIKEVHFEEPTNIEEVVYQ